MTAAIKVTITAFIVVLFAFSLLFIGIRAVGLATFVVTGGSMEPTIHKGSLVIDQPVTADKLNLGDVITFDHYDQTTTHRIVGVEGTANGRMFSTKGDANQVTDPEPLTFPGQVGVVKLAVPGLGYAVAWMQYIWRLGATLVAALIFFGCAAMVFLRKDPQAAPVLITERRAIATLPLAPVRVTPATNVDAQRIWADHQRWLRLAAVAEAKAA
jgi:signal peptidase